MATICNHKPAIDDVFITFRLDMITLIDNRQYAEGCVDVDAIVIMWEQGWIKQVIDGVTGEHIGWTSDMTTDDVRDAMPDVEIVDCER